MCLNSLIIIDSNISINRTTSIFLNKAVGGINYLRKVIWVMNIKCYFLLGTNKVTSFKISNSNGYLWVIKCRLEMTLLFYTKKECLTNMWETYTLSQFL